MSVNAGVVAKHFIATFFLNGCGVVVIRNWNLLDAGTMIQTPPLAETPAL
jgi:hypothetical protein